MAYPSTIDSFPNPTSATLENAAGFEHDVGHSALGDGLEAVMTELGTLPKGSAASVKARLTAMDAVDALRVVGSNQTTAPSSPVVGQVWVDHSTPATPVIKVWSGSAWVNPSSAGSGGAALVWATVTGGTVTTVTNPDGSTDEVHTFTAGGTLTVSAAGYARVLLVAPGGQFAGAGGKGSGGRVVRGLFALPAGAQAVTIPAPPTNNSVIGEGVSLGSLATGGTGVQATNPPAGAGSTLASPLAGVTDDITGTPTVYAPANDWAFYGGGAKYDAPHNGFVPGPGVVIVRVKVTPAPVLPAATGWAQVTGGTVTEYTKPDGSVMEVHTFTATGSNLTVVAAGYAECLVVGGGSAYQNTAAIEANGGGGDILSGLRALPAGTHAVTVGAGGTGGAPGNPTWQKVGQPSSIGAVLVTAVGRGHSGAGGTPGSASSILTPITSAITGTALTYGQAALTAPRANRGDGSDVGGGSPANGAAGVVIVAVQKTPPTASGVVATGGTESTFTGDGVNGVLGQTYKVHTFTAGGSLVVSAGGPCEIFVLSGGPYGVGGRAGGGGQLIDGVSTLSPGTVAVAVGAAGVYGPDGSWPYYAGKASALGSLNTGSAATYNVGTRNANVGAYGATVQAGVSSYISGTAVEYGKAAQSSPRANRGDGGAADAPGSTGVVIVRYKV